MVVAEALIVAIKFEEKMAPLGEAFKMVGSHDS
jgi:hypothetical protein